MNQKIINIAGIIFALVFVGIFIMLWTQSHNILGQEIDNMNNMYRAEVPFDISLIDNRVVTGQSIENLKAELNATSAYSVHLSIPSCDATKSYRCKIVRNSNNVITGIDLEQVD